MHISVVILSFLEAFTSAKATKVHPSDAQVQKILIHESISNYPGNCPCPYNTDRRGHSCGRRSAYSRAGGYETLCYDKDVTPEMIKDWRASHASSDSTRK